MTKKPAARAKKPAAAPEPVDQSGSAETRTLTLRLPAPVHDQLREMAFFSRRSQHSLMLEALNMLFERHGKPKIAT